MNAIAMRDVTVGYAGVAAVRNLRLTVPAGEVVALLGANGSGKTTTVRAVCGVADLQRGSVEVLGIDVTGASPRARARLGLATVADDRGLFAQLTVAENLDAGRVRRQVGLPLEVWFPGLVPLLGRRAGLLSGGEQTLLALARAMNSRPRAVVVDELTTGLAPVLARAALGALRRTASEWGTGVLLAEQSAYVALEFADRACVLRRGRLVFDGPPGDLAQQPGLLEAAYLGEMD